MLTIGKFKENISSLSSHPANISLPPFGQCYSISDGTPIDNFEMLKPLCEARLCNFPEIIIPTAVMLCLAFLLEKVHLCLQCMGISNSPFLTRSEIHKASRLLEDSRNINT